MKTLDCFFADMKWWRKLRGGRWEQWWVRDPVNGPCWIRGHHKREGLMRELLSVEYR